MGTQIMNQKLEKIRDELAKEIGTRLANPIIRSMYPSCSRGQMAENFTEIYKAGWNSAEPHIRQDERERIFTLLRSTIGEKVLRNYCPANTIMWLEQELKKIDDESVNTQNLNIKKEADF